MTCASRKRQQGRLRRREAAGAKAAGRAWAAWTGAGGGSVRARLAQGQLSAGPAGRIGDDVRSNPSVSQGDCRHVQRPPLQGAQVVSTARLLRECCRGSARVPIPFPVGSHPTGGCWRVWLPYSPAPQSWQPGTAAHLQLGLPLTPGP